MASAEVSVAEREFVLRGVDADVRADGRRRLQLRPTLVESELMSKASGSASVARADTNVVVVTRGRLEEKPGLDFSVEFSANAALALDSNREADKLGAHLAALLSRCYNEIFDFSQLEVVKDRKSWVICVEISVLSWGDCGSVLDCVGMAVKLALSRTRLPNVRAEAEDGGEVELELPDDPFDSIKVKIDQAPVLVTLAKLGDYLVADASGEEHACSSVSVVLAVTKAGHVTMANLEGGGSVHVATLQRAVKEGVEVAAQIHKELEAKMEEEEAEGDRIKSSIFS